MIKDTKAAVILALAFGSFTAVEMLGVYMMAVVAAGLAVSVAVNARWVMCLGGECRCCWTPACRKVEA